MQPKASHAYADIFPLRADDSLTELSDSMKAVGQLEDIVLLDGQVLDGRRRQLAAIRAGIIPRFRDFGSRPGDGNDPLDFAFATNYNRRTMSDAERVLAAVAFANLKRGRNTTNVGLGENSQADAAKKFGVNVKQIERAKAVMEKGTPELKEALKKELVSVSDAAAVADQPAKVQRQAVAAVASGTAKTLRGAVAALAGPAPETAAAVARDLDRIIARVERLATDQGEARTLAVRGLRSALAIVRRL